MWTWLLVGLAQAVPVQLPHQGRLVGPGGDVVDGAHTVGVTLYDASNTAIWTGSWSVDVADGYYAVVLGGGGSPALDSALFAQTGLRMGVTVDGTAMGPRSPLATVPYAAVADSLAAGATGTSLTLSGGLTLGSVTTCSVEGTLSWDAAADALRVCDGTAWRVIDTNSGSGFYRSAAEASARGLTNYWLFDSVWSEPAGFDNKVWTPYGATFLPGSTTSPFTGITQPADRPDVAEFDGTNDYARQPLRNITSTTYTMAVWVYLDAANPAGRTYIYDAQQSGRYYLIYDAANQPSTPSCSNQWYTATHAINGRWTLHFVRQTGGTIYYDVFGNGGFSQTNGGGNCVHDDTNAYLGTYYGAAGGSGQYFLNGKVAELAFWDGTFLSNTEIQAIFDAKLPLVYGR
jgi:hypothetical protein